MKPFAHHLHRVASATMPATGLPSDRAMPLMAAGTSKQKLEGIQACRGAAALLVLLFHVTRLTQEKLGQPFLFNLFAFGSAGVDFFFVLSGFILFFVHYRDLGQRDRLKPFVLKRLIRVYPLYWLLTLALLPIYFLVPQFGYGYERDFSVIIKSLLLIPQSHFPILIVGWSLCHEMLFYSMFALAILLPLNRSMPIILSWLLGTFTLLFLQDNSGLKLENNFLIQFVFNAHNVEFLLGCFAAYLVLQHRFRAQRLFLLLLGTALFLVFGIAQAERGLESNFIVAYGIPSTLILLGMGLLDVARSRSLPRPLSYLGDASYSLYLTHYPCLSLLFKLTLAAQLSDRIGYPLSISLLILITLLFGCLTYSFLEKPLVNVLRKMLVNPKPIVPSFESAISPGAMRILFLDQSGKLGGAELFLLDLTKPYRDRCLVCLFTDGPFKTALEKQGIPVQVIGAKPIEMKKESGLMQGLRSLGQLLPLAMAIAQLSRKYDLIYANTQKALVVGALASLISRRPLVYHLHDILSADHFSATNRRLAVTLANRFASRVIATSHATKTSFVAAGGRADLATVVYNGFEPTLYRHRDRDDNTLRQQLGLEGQFVVGHFSRLSPWKGQHILIEALRHCPPDVTAVFVGDALFGEQDYVQTLNAQVQTLGLQNRVRFLGFRADVVPLMQLCDVVAHTSTAPEPFGRVIVEAMLCGRPIIASASGGALELVKPGITGWLISPGDPQALADAITDCRTHAETTSTIVQAAQSEATQRFHLSHIQQQIDQLLQTVVHC